MQTLQPLGVMCFKPMASSYSNALTSHLCGGHGLLLSKEVISLVYSVMRV